MRRSTALAVCVWAQPALAEVPERIGPLITAMGMDQILVIMSDEGRDYGDTLEEDLFPGRGGAGWRSDIDRIYDATTMTEVMGTEMSAVMDDAALADAMAFFTSYIGEEIVALEVGARRAMLDPAVEGAAEESAAAAAEDPDAFYEHVTRFIEVNDLVEVNVIGGMNSNAAFYFGLMDGGALPQTTEAEILADVYGQAEDIRADTTQWLYSYLLLAYSPLDPASLDAYIAFSETPSGQTLNRAMFEGYDRLFVDISRALGLASARYMSAQEL